MPFTEAAAQKILNKILRAIDFVHPIGLLVSLHTAALGETGANELVGGDYTRKAVTYSAPVGKETFNPAVVEWDNMPACTVTHVGLWDQDGIFWWGGPLVVGVAIGAGDSFKLPIGSLPVTLT